MKKDRRTWDERVMEGKYFTKEEAEANKKENQVVIETTVVLGAKYTGAMTCGGVLTKVFVPVEKH